MKNGKGKLMLLALLILQFGVVGFAQASTNQTKVGKADDVTLSSITKVGNLTLQPGHYILQHKGNLTAHAMHFVSFTPYSGSGRARTYYGSYRTDVGAAECKMERLNAKIKKTQVFFAEENGVKRISKIEIKGENVAHLF